jgi:hypothetical protein
VNEPQRRAVSMLPDPRRPARGAYAAFPGMRLMIIVGLVGSVKHINVPDESGFVGLLWPQLSRFSICCFSFCLDWRGEALYWPYCFSAPCCRILRHGRVAENKVAPADPDSQLRSWWSGHSVRSANQQGVLRYFRRCSPMDRLHEIIARQDEPFIKCDARGIPR